MAELRFVRNDEMVPMLPKGETAYEIRDEDDHLLGAVASGPSSRGRVWFAARISASRKLLFGPTVCADSRHEAAEKLVARL